ncbi:hypothetical protein ZIOFF_059421 [Zingiber officinale]|uniref:BED-type domain-containing protein n=1 Tax=Zingiber officinale TaxID=94328 RepID=A0A8J5F9F5_ZINOF|nr:hypothetical protein ZIOFF_059421 [Zingiber officinale]
MDSTSQKQTVILDDELESAKHDKGSIKRSKETSDIGVYFKKIKGVDSIDKVECIGCKKQYKCGGKQYGTSTLWRHLKIYDKLKFNDVGQMILDQDGKMRSKKINQKLSRELLACAIIRHDLPFSFVEYDGIRTWIKYINPDVACISRNTLVSDINRIYLKEKEKLKYVLTTIQNREMVAYESQTITSAGKSQLDLYLEEPKLEFAYYQDLDILEHWKNQKHRYPTLALMACDVLAIPITTVASESAFSIYKDNENNASIKTTFSKQESNTLEEDINEEKGGEGGSEEIDVDDSVDLRTVAMVYIVDLLNLRTVVPVVE